MTHWPPGDGEMVGRIRAFDWSATPLGPIEGWPPSLRVATRLLLNTRHPMFIWWGPELIQLYNDAYRGTMGSEKHPSALGSRGRDTWAEIWDVIGPQIAQVMGGGPATWHEDQLVPVTRHGGRQRVWWTYGFSPIDDEAAPHGIGGVLVICRDVTAEHLAKRKAQENEARYRELFEAMEEGYLVADVIFDGEGRAIDIEYREANPAATRMVGTDVTGRRLRDIDPDYEEYWYETFGRVARTGVSERSVLYAKPGNRWYDFHVSKLRTSDPTSTRVGVLFFDASVRVRTELALRESEALRRIAIDGGGMGTWRWDLRERLVWGDVRFLALWGVPPSGDAHPLSLFVDRMSPTGAGEMADMVAKATAAGEEFDDQLEVTAGPTAGRWVRWRGRAESERPWIVNGVSFDVTAQRLAEDRLRESEERQRLTTELVPALLWTADPAGRDIAITDRWKRYTGQSEEEVQSHGWLAAVHPDDREATRAAFARAFATGQPLERQHRIRQAGNGHRWHFVRHVPVRDAEGTITGWFGAAIDVHDLHELQDQQRVLVAELQHRTRNLIAVVKGIANDTMRQTGPTDAFRAAFSDRLSALSRVQGLLSRSEAEPITFGSLLRLELDALGAGAAGKRVTAAGPEVHLRPSTVQTLALALHELATNARKHGALSHEGGRLAVSWRQRTEAGESRLAIEWVETGLEQVPDRPASDRGEGGYGRELIEQALPHALGARTSYALSASGVRCTIDLAVRPGEGEP